MQLILGEQNISLDQLWLLGAEIEQKVKGINIPIIPPHTQFPAEFDPSRDKNQISIRADYWISWLLDTFEKIQSPNELNWLIASAKFLQFRGEAEMVRRIKEMVTVLEEPRLYTDLPTNRKNSLLYLWLEDFLTNYTDAPGVIYVGKKRSEKVKREVKSEDNEDSGQQDVADSDLESLFQQKDNIEDSLYKTDEEKNRHILMKKLLLKGLKSFGLGGSKALLEVLKNAKGCILDTTLGCEELLSKNFHQEIDDLKVKKIEPIKKVKNVLQVVKILERFEIKKKVNGFWKNKYAKGYIGPGLALTIWDAYDAGKVLANPHRTAKETRDAIATFTFMGGELTSTGAMVALGASTGVGIIVSAAWTVGSFVYSGFSMLNEYWNENFSAWERYVTYSRGFMQMDLHPKLQTYLGHRQILNQMANEIYSILQEKPNVYFIASAIGQYNPPLTYEEFVINKYGSQKMWKDLSAQVPLDANLLISAINDPNAATYNKEYENYLANLDILLSIPINITLGENEIRKLSRLTPDTPGAGDAVLYCGPNIRKDEPLSTGRDTYSDWSCDNSFILGRSSSSQEVIPGPGVFDLRRASAGQVKLDNKKVNFESEFYLGNNSTLVIYAPRFNSPGSRFILPSEAFFGELIGDPDYSFSSNTTSTIDASQVNEKHRIELTNSNLVFRETLKNNVISTAHFHHIQRFIGHTGQNSIDCKTTNIKIVDTKGGTPENVDIMLNCNQAIVSSYTHIRNNHPDPAYYTIKPDSRYIDMQLSNKLTIIKFPESIVTLLKDYQFQLDLGENILIIKKTGSVDYVLKIFDFVCLDSTIQFVDTDGIIIIPHFVTNETEEETRPIANEFHYIMQSTDRKSALAKHQAIVENNPDKQILGQSYYANRNFANPPQAILGTKGNNLILIKLTDVDYVAGNEGADIYKIKNKESLSPTVTTIDNYTPSLPPEIDEIHLPFSKDKISCQRDQINNDLFCREKHDTQLRFKNALNDTAYQHFFLIDKNNKMFIPMDSNNNDKIDLIPYYSIQHADRFLEVAFDTLDTSFPLEIAIEGELPVSFRLYRDWNRVRLVGYAQGATDANLIVSMPAEQFKSTMALKIFSTHHASAITEESISMTLRLSNYLSTIDGRNSFVKMDYYIKKHKINWNNLRFDNTIGTTIEIGAQQLAYFSLDQVPSDVELKGDKNDLLITLYNDQLQTSIIRVVNGLDNAQRLQGIIIKGKLLPIDLADQAFDNESLEEFTNVFRINLVQQWVSEQLGFIPFRLRQEALYKILDCISRHSLRNAIDFFQEINLAQGLENEELIKFFVENIYLAKKEITFTPNEEKEIGKAILLMYATHVLQNANFDYTDVAHPFLPQAVHNLLFKNFELIMPRNFLLLNEKIQTYLLDPYVALNTFFNIANEEKKQQLVKSYHFKLEELVRDDNREEVISHNQDPMNYKIGEIELNDLPLSGEYTLDGNAALLTVYNAKEQQGTLRIKGWNDLHHRLERIVIKKKSIPILMTLSPESREASTKLLRQHLVDLWIEEELADIPAVAKQKALFKVIEQIHQTSSLEKGLNLYHLWGYNSQENLRLFYEGYSSKAISDEEENEATKAFILYYTRILTFYSNYFENFSKVIPEKRHQFFSTTLFHGNYTLTEIIKFRNTLFNPQMLRKVIPKLLNSGKKNYEYEIGNDQFYEKTTDIVIYTDSEPDNAKLRYLCFDAYPADFVAEEGNDALLLRIYNDLGKSRIIRVMNWRNPLARLDYIIVAGKQLSTHLAVFPLNQKLLDQLSGKLRLDLLEKWLDGELLKLDYKAKKSAIVSLTKPLLKSHICQDNLKYELFNFKSTESLVIFYGIERKKTQIEYPTKEEWLEKQKAILLYYAKFYIRCPKDISIFRNIVSKEAHNTLFEKDFWETIKDDFIRGSKKLKKNIFNLVTEADEHSLEITQKNKRSDNSLRLGEEENRHSNIIRFKLNPNTSHTIYHNQFQYGIETWITEVEEERKNFFIDLGEVSENKLSVNNLSITREKNDLIFSFRFNNDIRSKAQLSFKEYDSDPHRISGIIINDEIVEDNLNFLRIEDYVSIENRIKAALTKNWTKQKQLEMEMLKPEQPRHVTFFLISNALAQPLKDIQVIANVFGFNAPRELMEFYNAYLTDYPNEKDRTDFIYQIYQVSPQNFFSQIYLQVIKASQSGLTDKQIQQTFPFLTSNLLTDVIQCYRPFDASCPTGIKSVDSPPFHSEKLLRETIEKEMVSDIRTISVASRTIYLTSEKPAVPYVYAGFREKAFLDVANIRYDTIKFVRRKNILQIILAKGEHRKVTKMIYTDWFNPLYQLSGLKDNRKGWQYELPDVPHDLQDQTLLKRMQQDINQILLDANKTQSIEISQGQTLGNQAQPQVSANRMNIHSVETLGHHSRKSEEITREQENERSLLPWLNWLGAGVGVLVTGIGGCAAWLLYRRRRVRRNLLPTVTETVAASLPLLRPVTSNDAYIETDNHVNCLKESLSESYFSAKENMNISNQEINAQIFQFVAGLNVSNSSNSKHPITTCVVYTAELFDSMVPVFRTCEDSSEKLSTLKYRLPKMCKTSAVDETQLACESVEKLVESIEKNAKSFHAETKAAEEYIQVMEVIEAFESLQAKFSIVDNSLYLMEFICGWYHKYKERKLEEKFSELVGITDNALAEQETLSISTSQQEMWQSLLDKSKHMFNELAELLRSEEQLQASKNFRDNSSKNILFCFIQNVTEVLFPKPLSKLAISLNVLNDLLMTHQETVDEFVQKGVATREATQMTTEACNTLFQEILEVKFSPYGTNEFDDTRNYFEEKFYDAYDYFSFNSFAGNYDTQTPFQGSVYEGSFEAFYKRFRMRNRRFHQKRETRRVKDPLVSLNE